MKIIISRREIKEVLEEYILFAKEGHNKGYEYSNNMRVADNAIKALETKGVKITISAADET